MTGGDGHQNAATADRGRWVGCRACRNRMPWPWVCHTLAGSLIVGSVMSCDELCGTSWPRNSLSTAGVSAGLKVRLW